MTVFDDGRLVASLPDGAGIEIEIGKSLEDEPVGVAVKCDLDRFIAFGESTEVCQILLRLNDIKSEPLDSL